MTRLLPPRPNLGQLRNQAKDVLKAHRSGDAAVCGTLRLLRQFSSAPDRDILAADLTLNEAQFALAMDYGFPSWNALKTHVESLAPAQTRKYLKREGNRVWIVGPARAWRETVRKAQAWLAPGDLSPSTPAYCPGRLVTEDVGQNASRSDEGFAPMRRGALDGAACRRRRWNVPFHARRA